MAYDKDCCSRRIYHYLTGVGTFLIGLGAIIAAYKTDTILDNILAVRSVVKKIDIAVDALKSVIVKNFAQEKINKTILSSPTSTLDQIKKEIGLIPNKPIGNRSTIILPQQSIRNVSKELFQSKDIQERAQILENALEYIPAQEKQ